MPDDIGYGGPMPRYRVEWATEAGRLAAREPTAADVAAAAPALAAAYSDPHNAPLMGHDHPLDADDVIAHYADLAAGDDRAFLLSVDGALAGDADFRDLDDGAAEYTIMVAAPAAQGRGLGTRFAIMTHAFGFRGLGLARVYVSIVPANLASQRLFARLGYRPDDSPAARAYIDEPDDLTFSIDRETFERRHADALAAIRIAPCHDA
jgi:RimJ/RimL family protein N-acetyltransferase